jgi:Kdo2-lipid IVA lauroyltransferase/acyltransferase
MKYLGYIITSTILRLLAILPPPFLYLKADALSFLLNQIVGYRKKVISGNLTSTFPGMSTREILSIRRKFYRHLADVIIETAVIQFYPKSRLEKMFSFDNPELLDKYYREGRHVIVMGGHYNNWEWSSPFSYTFRHKFIGVYRPLHNIYFDRAYRKSRKRFGAEVVPMGSIARILFEYDGKNVPTIIGMVGDQRPIKNHVQYWTNFLNHTTGFFTGSEKLAKKFNAVVVFGQVRKISRGSYSTKFELISDNPTATAPNEITEKFARLLENEILEEPAYWLWSHNRWKFSYDDWLKSNPTPSSTNPSA